MKGEGGEDLKDKSLKPHQKTPLVLPGGQWSLNPLPGIQGSLLWGSAGKESTFNAGDLGSIAGLGRFPWRKERLPTPVFWSGEFHGLYSPWSLKESDMTE